MTNQSSTPSLSETTRTWARIGIVSFGGPAAQISLMHNIVVDEKGWLKERQFLNALNFCMLLPGPEAMQLATYSGWRMHGVIGGLIAGLLFVLPGALVILALASIYVTYGQLPLVQSLFLGIKAAVLLIVIRALISVSSKALRSNTYIAIAGISFVAIFFLKIPYPLIVLATGLLGFYLGEGNEPEQNDNNANTPVSIAKTLKTVFAWLLIWWMPVAMVWVLDDTGFFTDIAVFFSKLAVVTFGGAYAVLAYMAQDVVDANQWLTATQMIDALGLAETTPGPLILVTEFVGFLSGYGHGGILSGIAAALLTLWVTFIPCFLWIFAGAPYIEVIAAHPKARGALSAITAAVVGVILNLSIWFALHVMFASAKTHEIGHFQIIVPEVASVDWHVLLLAFLSAILLFVLRLNIILALAISALGGILLSFV